MKYERILRALSATPWMILPAKLEEIFGVVEARAAGVTLSARELKHFAARKKKYTGVNGNVAVLPVYGTISQRFGLLTASGGTSTDEFCRAFDQALADASIGAILADFDTPGGSVFGVQEAFNKVFAARGQKPLVASVNSQAASAGYYLACAFDEIVVTPSGELGSVGVISAHVDYSAQNAADGVKVTYITAGQYKAEMNPDSPLSDEAKAYEQSVIDAYYAAFVDSVAQGRGVTTRAVKADFGQGRCVLAADAVEKKMADRVAPFSQVLAELNAAAKPPGTGRRPVSGAQVALLRKKLALRK